MAERIAPRTYYTKATIGTDANGLSDIIDDKGYRLAKIFMPTEWTVADLTFQESPSPDGTFQDLYDDVVLEALIGETTPAEVTIKVSAGQNTVISSNKDKFTGMTYFRLRSGTSALPVPQTAERTIGLLFVGI